MRMYGINVHRVHRLIWLVVTLLVLLGSLFFNVHGAAYMVLSKEPFSATTSPSVILQSGTAGTSTIYTNNTSSKASVAALRANDTQDYVDNNISNIDSSDDKGTHSNFTAQKSGPDSVYDTLMEENVTVSITYENSAESYSAIGQSSHSFYYSLQKGSGNDRLIVITVSWEDAEASASISSLAFAGIAMLNVTDVTVGVGYSEYISLWYLLDSSLPSSPGSYNVAVTVSESIAREIYVAVAEYSGVKQSAPDDFDIDANTVAGNTAINLTAAADGSLVVAGVGEGDTNVLTDTNNIDNLQEQVLTSSGSALGHHINVDSGNITVGWNNLATREGMVGAVWQPAFAYNLDLEIQWTNADYDEANEELAIYANIKNNTYSLDATGGYMIVGDGTPDWGSATGTISFWIKMDTSVQGRFWGQDGNMETRWSGTNLVLDWGATTSMNSAYSFSADTWYFVAIVWDENNNNLFLYIGDENNIPSLDANSLSGTWTSTTPAPTENRFMNGLGGNEPLDGHGDDLRYWNTARTLVEIQSDYDRELTGSETNLRSYFKLNNNFDDIGLDNNDGSGFGSYSFSSDVPFDAPPSENIRVDAWNGTAWQNLFTDLSTGWNNISVSSYLISSNFTIRLTGSNENGDTFQDSWDIDVALLHVWTFIETTYDYVLKVNNTVTDSWQIRVKKYSDSNINRLQNCTIYFHNSTDGTSGQIYIENGVYTQDVGSWYNLPSSATIYITMTVEANSMGASYIYAYLEILIPNTTTYTQYIVTFEIT